MINSARESIIAENKKIMHYSDEHKWTKEQIKNTALSELMASITPMWLNHITVNIEQPHENLCYFPKVYFRLFSREANL